MAWTYDAATNSEKKYCLRSVCDYIFKVTLFIEKNTLYNAV